MGDSREFQTKLTDLVKKHPCLYNTWNKYQKEAWKSISEEIGIPDFMLQEQWKKMRTRYISALKQNKKSELDETLEFLRSHLEFEVKPSQQEASTSATKANDGVEHEEPEPDDVVDLEEDLWANNEEDGSSPPKKRKTNYSQSVEFGAQYLANPVLNDTGSTTTGPIRDFITILSSTLEDLTEEQLKKFKRRAFVLLNDIVDEK